MAKTTTPEVGMGATRYSGSDAYPYTIVSVSATGNKIEVTRDTARRIDSNGLSESQDWDIATDPDAVPTAYSRRKDGHFYPVGVPMDGYSMMHVGSRRRFSDPHF